MSQAEVVVSNAGVKWGVGGSRLRSCYRQVGLFSKLSHAGETCSALATDQPLSVASECQAVTAGGTPCRRSLAAAAHVCTMVAVVPVSATLCVDTWAKHMCV